MQERLESDCVDRSIKIKDTLMFYLYLMRRQYFHDCNKRTATLFVNLLFNFYGLNCFLWFPTLDELAVFLDKLQFYYENVEFKTDFEFVDYLYSTWLVDFSV